MIQELAIVHRRKPRLFSAATLESTPVWATCLRALAFVDGRPNFELHPDDEIHTQEGAYQFLLEILCGLHSPIVGETEVFGQFKNFAQEWALKDPSKRPLIQRLLNDVKVLRAQHLSGLGNQSYGSWLRRHLQATKIHVIGAGHLAQEILPYLAKHGEVVVHARDLTKVTFHDNAQALNACAFDEGALVIAAPVTAAAVEQWLQGRQPKQIFDLRDDSAVDRVCARTVPLQQIFGDIERTKARLLPVVERIKTEIRARSLVLAAQEKVRPQGWDDLCA